MKKLQTEGTTQTKFKDMPKYSESIHGSSAVGHPIFRFFVVAAPLLFAESLAIHPSTHINSRSRRFATAGRFAKQRNANGNDLITPAVLQLSDRSITDSDEIAHQHGISAENVETINTINKDNNIEDVQKTSFKSTITSERSVSIWPQFDDLDKRITKIALPCIANFAINPLIGAVDLFWVNRMGNALAVAGQAAANQVFNTAYWMVSFLPSGKLYIVCTL